MRWDTKEGEGSKIIAVIADHRKGKTLPLINTDDADLKKIG
jgi:hypothetical protein